MRNTIEFQSGDNVASPTPNTKTQKWSDETYQEDYSGIQVRFDTGLNWLRIIPSIKPSQFAWMMPFKRYHDKEGRFPTFVDPTFFGVKSVFESARWWLKKTHPDRVFNKTQPNGIRLFPQERGLCWVLDTKGEAGRKIRLLNTSTYDGARGGSVGLGAQIHNLAEAVDKEPGSPTLGQKIYGDITDPEAGRLIGIEATKGGEYTSYAVKIGNNAHRLNLEDCTDEEVSLLVPLEKVLKQVTEEEETKYLAALLGPELFKEFAGAA